MQPARTYLSKALKWVKTLGADARQGIVGALVVALLILLAKWFGGSVELPTWALVAMVAVLGGTLLWEWFANRRRQRAMRQALDKTTAISAMDQHFLGRMAGAPDDLNEQDLRALVQPMLEEATTKVFGAEVYRASIFRPSAEFREGGDPDYLERWESYGMQPASGNSARFYIGDDQARCVREGGIAGIAFQQGSVQVAHYDQVKGKGVCDHPDYLPFTERDRTDPPFRSFVAIPLLGAERRPLGVLCFDSPNRAVFDAPELTQMLTALGQRFAAALLIYAYVKKGRR